MSSLSPFTVQGTNGYQEWWDKEAARVQEAEQRSAAAATRASNKKSRGRRGKPAKGEKEKEKPIAGGESHGKAA